MEQRGTGDASGVFQTEPGIVLRTAEFFFFFFKSTRQSFDLTNVIKSQMEVEHFYIYLLASSCWINGVMICTVLPFFPP